MFGPQHCLEKEMSCYQFLFMISARSMESSERKQNRINAKSSKRNVRWPLWRNTAKTSTQFTIAQCALYVMFDQIIAHAIFASFLDWNLAAKFDLITSQQSNPLISSVGNDGDRLSQCTLWCSVLSSFSLVLFKRPSPVFRRC